MKRLIIAAIFLMALAWPAATAAAPPSWNLTGVYTVNFTCTGGCAQTYIHSMTITTSNDITGAVVGTGFVEGYVGYDWTVTGTVSGSDVTLDIEWTGPAGMEIYNPLMLTGSIDSSGHMSGTAIDAQERTFTWATTEGAAAPVATPTPTATPTPVATPTPTATPTPVATPTPTATPTPVATATPTPFQVVQGATATPVRTVTPPPTSTGSGSSSDHSTPLFALLICLAFSGLGLVAVTAQRRSIRS